MKRGSTPTIRYTLPFNTTEIAVAYVTFKQSPNIIIDKTLDHSTAGTTLSVTLSQAETLQFRANEPVLMQLRIKKNDSASTVLVSNILKAYVGETLKDGVI